MREMSSLDIMFLLNELKLLINGRIQKVYQDGKKLRFQIFLSGKGTFELYFEPGKLFITDYKRHWDETGSFGMLLRKHLKNQRIFNITQKDFDRIVEIETENYIIILEIFSKGNIIFCYKDYKILQPLQVQRWKHRTIKPGVKYEYPPSVINPFKLSLEEFKKLLNEKDIVKFLATDLSFSGLYAEEICIRSGINKNKIADQLNDDEIKTVYEVINHLKNQFAPQAIVENGKAIDAVPFDMKYYEGKEILRATTFTRTLDEIYSKEHEIKDEIEQNKNIQKKIEKLEKIAEKQKQAIEEMEKEEIEKRKSAELVFANLEKVNDVISQINEMKNKKMKWEEIKERLKNSIKGIDEKKGKFIFNTTEVDFRKSAQDNANEYFKQSKIAKKKLEGARRKLEKTLQEIDEPRTVEIKESRIKKKKEREWYEKFHWTVSAEGFLIIGGKNAQQNDIIFKKYIDKDDIVLHADVTGSPLTVIKSHGKQVSQNSIIEAAELAGAYSSAWKRGLGVVDVYWINPDQVSKTPESGEYLSKGAFVIRGNKNYLRKIELKISIGIKEDGSVIAGNVQSVKKQSKYFVTIKPGDINNIKLSVEIKRTLMDKASEDDKELIQSIDLDDIQRLIPSGEGTIV